MAKRNMEEKRIMKKCVPEKRKEDEEGIPPSGASAKPLGSRAPNENCSIYIVSNIEKRTSKPKGPEPGIQYAHFYGILDEIYSQQRVRSVTIFGEVNRTAVEENKAGDYIMLTHVVIGPDSVKPGRRCEVCIRCTHFIYI